jgi:hypothetical protein
LTQPKPPTNPNRFQCQKKQGVPDHLNGCNKTFVAHSPAVVQQMPAFVQQQFPFVRMGKKLVTRSLVRLVRDMMAETGNVSACLAVIHSLHKTKHVEMELLYYQENNSLRARCNIPRALIPPKYPSYEEVGVKLTHHLIRSVFTLDAAAREEWVDRCMEMVAPGWIIKWDESFKTVKVMKVNGEQPFGSLLLIMNGSHEVLSFVVSPDQSQASFEETVRGLAARIKQHGWGGPRVMYTDQCCRDRNFVTAIFPSLLDPRGNAEGKKGMGRCDGWGMIEKEMGRESRDEKAN